MMEMFKKSPASFGQRCLALNAASHAVRQRATGGADDLEGWLLSRLMRDASTDGEVNIAERKYNVWLQTIPPQGRFSVAQAAAAVQRNTVVYWGQKL
jgi:hypothetical protein